jgi:hypothetical protein
MSAQFQVIGADGLVESDNPKLDAMKYAAWIAASNLGPYTFIANAGRFTVIGNGCSPMTFYQRDDNLQELAARLEERRTTAAAIVARYGEA